MLFAYTKEKEMISAVESDNQQQFFFVQTAVRN